MGIFSALLRWLGFKSKRTEQAINRAADKEFTGSVSGIRDAFDIAHDKLVSQYQELRDAIAQVEMVLEQDRQQLEKLNSEEEKLIGQRDGALAMFEKAISEGDAKEQATHEQAFKRFDERIQQIEAEQANLEGRISAQEDGMQTHLHQLTKLQDEIRRLPEEKARQMAEFVSNQKMIELNDRLSGLQKSIDRGPIEAVRSANKELSAKARVSQKLAGTDVELQDDQYARASQSEVTSNRMKEMLAARRAERGDKPQQDDKKLERPEI